MRRHLSAIVVTALALAGCAGASPAKSPDLAALEDQARRVSQVGAVSLTLASGLHDEARVGAGFEAMAQCPPADVPCREAAKSKALADAQPRGAALKGAVAVQEALKAALETRAKCRADGDAPCVLEQAAIVEKLLPELEGLVEPLKGMVSK